jgi:uncharacterized membrane protein
MIRFFTPLKLFLLAAMAVTVVVGFVLVPAGTMLPVHWNIAGEADCFLPREWGLLFPAGAVLLVWSIFMGVDRFAKPADREAGAHVVSVVLTALTATFLAIAVATVAIGVGVPISMVQVIAVAMGVLLVILGNAMPKSRPNSFAGIRMPTTLRSETNWLATHRLTGRLTIIAGILLLGAAFLVPVQTLVWWVIGCVIGPMVIGTAYSLILARRSA